MITMKRNTFIKIKRAIPIILKTLYKYIVFPLLIVIIGILTLGNAISFYLYYRERKKHYVDKPNKTREITIGH